MDWWRFVTPISSKWVFFTEARITYYSIFIFGIRIMKVQTNNPATGR